MKSTSSLSRLAGAVIGGAAALGADLVSPLLGAPTALAVPLCEAPPAVRVLRSGLGILECAIVDPDGRLFVSNQNSHGLAGSVMRIDHPDAEPIELAAPTSHPLCRPRGSLAQTAPLRTEQSSRQRDCLRPYGGCRPAWCVGIGGSPRRARGDC